MKLFKKYVSAVIVVFILCSCENTNENQQVQIRDYAVQYNEDIVKIEEYLKTHSVTVIDHAGFADDQNATFTSVPSLDVNSMWGSNPLTPKSSLLYKYVNLGGVEHKIYFIKFRNGTGVSPLTTSQIKAYYKGYLLNDTLFDSSLETGAIFYLNQLILGWGEILPQFKTGTVVGGNQYDDFGAGAMFLPSAMAYYQYSVGPIPSYSPVIFNFKLFETY